MPTINPRTYSDLLRAKTTKFQFVQSHCVADVSFDPESETMTVQFQQRGTYNYHNVGITEYVDFSQASSKGAYFNLYIRDRYSYERIS